MIAKLARAMALLFGTLTIWMAVRFVALFVSTPPPPAMKGANPTTWMTVFGYIIMMSLISVCVMWMEVDRLKEDRSKDADKTRNLSGFVEYFRNKLLLLWSAVSVLIVCVVSMLGIGYVNIREMEKARLIRSAELVTDAYVDHTILIANQVDALLRSVRGYYLRTRSFSETESFIHSLGFDRAIIDNLYLIGADGRIVISHNPATLGRSIADREYFKFHRATNTDTIFVSSVEPDWVIGTRHFRITRRIDNPDGTFGGLALATINPEAFARYYRDLSGGAQSSASLLGIADRKLRARVPQPSARNWSETLDSPLWEALQRTSSGHYENTSQFDNFSDDNSLKNPGRATGVFARQSFHQCLREEVRLCTGEFKKQTRLNPSKAVLCSRFKVQGSFHPSTTPVLSLSKGSGHAIHDLSPLTFSLAPLALHHLLPRKPYDPQRDTEQSIGRRFWYGGSSRLQLKARPDVSGRGGEGETSRVIRLNRRKEDILTSLN